MRESVAIIRTWSRLLPVAAVALTAGSVPALAAEGGVATRAGIVPAQVLFAVHGRVIGWTAAGRQWFVVYLAGRPGGACGLEGATWRLALVSGAPLPYHVVDDRALVGAMCGNELAWVRGGRFTDGRHAEAAFMLWTTPSIGATTYVYRVDGERLERVASIPGDKALLRRGTVSITWENAGRSPNGELTDTYRWRGSRYVLERRK